MAEVQFTVDEVCAILGLKHSTVVQYCRGQVDKDDKEGKRIGRRFPHSYIPHDAPKLGYRIPESDLIAYAKQQGSWLEERVDAELSRRRANDPVHQLQAV